MTGHLVVSWDNVDAMCRRLSEQLAGGRFDAVLAIARGGLVPAALVSQHLALRRVLVASVASYESDRRGDVLKLLEYPPDDALSDRKVLVVDDIWDSGRTAVTVRRRVRDAGGRPTLAVLHYKPSQSRFPEEQPDLWLETTDKWVVYPWEADAPVFASGG